MSGRLAYCRVRIRFNCVVVVVGVVAAAAATAAADYSNNQKS